MLEAENWAIVWKSVCSKSARSFHHDYYSFSRTLLVVSTFRLGAQFNKIWERTVGLARAATTTLNVITQR
jgi:hypothetical protein